MPIIKINCPILNSNVLTYHNSPRLEVILRTSDSDITGIICPEYNSECKTCKINLTKELDKQSSDKSYKINKEYTLCLYAQGFQPLYKEE